MAKNLFSGLVKITGSKWSNYHELISGDSSVGKLVFADITGDEVAVHNGKYIFANGIEYKVADATNLDELITRVENVSAGLIDLSTFVRENVNTSIANVSTRLNDLSTYVHNVVDASIDRLDTSVSTLEIWKSEHADPSLNAFDSSLKDHETRITTLETNAKDALEEATLSSAVASETATITLTTIDASGDTITSSVSVSGDDYVKVGGSANAITLATTVGTIETATADASGLATAYDVSVFVHNAISGIEGALVYRGTVASESDLDTAAATASKGDVYVASTSFAGTTYSADEGDMFIWNGSTWNRVERNLDQAVQATSATAFTDGNLIIGKGNHLVEGTNVALADVQTAMVNANSAIQGVIANVSTSQYLDASAAISSSTATVTVGVKMQDVSTASVVGQGLADAKQVKDYVDDTATDIKVQYTLDTSTSDYVQTAATVDNTGRIISSSVGVIVGTLADASDGGDNYKALADARDVYERLTEVEQVIATAQTTMADTLGMESDFSVDWTSGLGFDEGDTYKDAIEKVAQKTATGVVTSFGGKVGDITIGAATNANDVSFWMDGSTLKGSVDYTGLEGRIADVSQHAIDNDASIVDISTRVIPALQAKDVEIDASIDRLDASVSALENANYVHTLSGESAIAGGDGNFVAVKVDTSTGDVTLSSELKLAENTYGSTTATGLATDAYVQDYLAWEVISD